MLVFVRFVLVVELFVVGCRARNLMFLEQPRQCHFSGTRIHPEMHHPGKCTIRARVRIFSCSGYIPSRASHPAILYIF